MKILSSSPYAVFNPREWRSLPKTSHRFSNTPIKIKKKYLSTFRDKKCNNFTHENSALPKQIQLAFI